MKRKSEQRGSTKPDNRGKRAERTVTEGPRLETKEPTKSPTRIIADPTESPTENAEGSTGEQKRKPTEKGESSLENLRQKPTNQQQSLTSKKEPTVVVGLYPNLNIRRSAEECRREAEESQVEYEGLDYEFAGKFIASNLSQAEVDKAGMSRIVPRRRYNF